MMIMTLFILRICFVQYVMELLEYVLNTLKEVVRPVSFRLDMS